MTYQLTKYDIECLGRIAGASGIGIENLLKSRVNAISASRAPGRLLTIKEDQEQERALRMFAEEKAKAKLEREDAEYRNKIRRKFNTIEFHDTIMDRLDRGGTYI